MPRPLCFHSLLIPITSFSFFEIVWNDLILVYFQLGTPLLPIIFNRRSHRINCYFWSTCTFSSLVICLRFNWHTLLLLKFLSFLTITFDLYSVFFNNSLYIYFIYLASSLIVSANSLTAPTKKIPIISLHIIDQFLFPLNCFFSFLSISCSASKFALFLVF